VGASWCVRWARAVGAVELKGVGNIASPPLGVSRFSQVCFCMLVDIVCLTLLHLAPPPIVHVFVIINHVIVGSNGLVGVVFPLAIIAAFLSCLVLFAGLRVSGCRFSSATKGPTRPPHTPIRLGKVFGLFRCRES
jgi:hypothetical protein